MSVSPLLILAGHWLGGLGVVVMLLSRLADTMDEMKPCRGGAKYGALMLGAGVLVTGAGYVVMAAGTLSVIFGVGLGAFTGVKAYVGHRQAKRIEECESLLLKGGE